MVENFATRNCTSLFKMIRSVTPLAQSVQRQTGNLVDQFDAWAIAGHWNDDALRILPALTFKCVERKCKLRCETLCSNIADNRVDLLANGCFDMCKSRSTGTLLIAFWCVVLFFYARL